MYRVSQELALYATRYTFCEVKWLFKINEVEELADGKMTVPATTSLVPSAGPRTLFLFLPLPDAMSSARIAGAKTPPDATIAADAEVSEGNLFIKPKSPDTGDFGFSGSTIVYLTMMNLTHNLGQDTRPISSQIFITTLLPGKTSTKLCVG